MTTCPSTEPFQGTLKRTEGDIWTLMKLASGALAPGFTARALHRDQDQMANDSVYSSPQYFTVKARFGGNMF